MIRVVSGSLRGRRLQVPSVGARPTAERVRAAIFNALGSYMDLAGAHVLDLYAGSGALGVEAISRGADTAVLVEHATKAVKALRMNVDSLDLSHQVTIQAGKVLQVVSTTTPRVPYDLVLADPPYDIAVSEIAEVLATLKSNNWLDEQGILVWERSSKIPSPWPPGWELVKSYRYGDTSVDFARLTSENLVADSVG